jgi:hypothetical protein
MFSGYSDGDDDGDDDEDDEEELGGGVSRLAGTATASCACKQGNGQQAHLGADCGLYNRWGETYDEYYACELKKIYLLFSLRGASLRVFYLIYFQNGTKLTIVISFCCFEILGRYRPEKGILEEALGGVVPHHHRVRLCGAAAAGCSSHNGNCFLGAAWR